MIKTSILAVAFGLVASAAFAEGLSTGYDPVSSPQAATTKACVTKLKKQEPGGPMPWYSLPLLNACITSDGKHF